ncbi:L-idonate 5-dehydrogenase [uncultured Jannaschia sp.]|uniref:L-idonate 5-dehydrogenase n=1 Tax=uncultured Jannaschia sp. TaxID=293347 RepID=UPI0026305A69|nr:L-idonate 5-dehydrogenase [uncultured Jannaschia sp.]
MRSIVIHGERDLRIEEGPAETPGPGQVQVRMAAGGICGSDLHYYQHGGIGTAIRVREPLVLGHEVSGHVAALGEGVEGLTVGQLVAVSPSRPCGQCRYCLEGMPNQCLHMRFYGSAMPFPHIQGAFREMLVADAAQCVPADGLSPAEAAMAEPLAVCLHATRQAGEMVGRSVLVTGCGPIGILSILCARRAGADLVVATDLSDFTLEMARAAGADVTVNMRDGDLSAYEAEKGTFDVLYECSGAAPALAAGIAAMRPGGTIVQLGLGGDMTVPMQALTAKELSLRGSFRFHAEFAAGVSLMQKGLIDVTPFVTHSFAVEDVIEAFETAGDRSRAMKAQIAFS